MRTASTIIEVNTRIPSVRNQQVLCFRPVLADEPSVLPLIRLGGALPELHLPLSGTEPNAFIVICSTVSEDRYVDIDLGISAQSMLLRAAEIGLNGICIGLSTGCGSARLRLPVRSAVAVGHRKGVPNEIELVEIGAEESHAYYRRDGVHYVPKVRLADLLIARDGD